MASAFGHALAAIALGKSFPKSMATWKFILLGIICSIIPDADVITFSLPYEHLLGHRGFFHSFLFAVILGVGVTLTFYPRKMTRWSGLGLILYFTLCTASHSLLDAMTSGGLGVAFFSPWDNTRYFLPWRPIKVSPIGIDNFFSNWDWEVIKSELIWIGIPSIIVLIFLGWFENFKIIMKLIR
jgi:inner membrane protein